MASITIAGKQSQAAWHSHVGIPVRNLWLLLVYAYDLAEFLDRSDVAADTDSPDLAELLAKLLTVVVERRLRRNLSRDYQPRRAALSRVRGRIDWLGTESEMLLQRGLVMCRFEELTYDTPRNRLVRSALDAMRSRVADRALSRHCGQLGRFLEQSGVSDRAPSRSELSRIQFNRNDADDRLMVTVADLALNLVLPSEFTGDARLPRLSRDEALLRRIFEKAVAGLYRHELRGTDWRVRPQSGLKWQTSDPTSGIGAVLPNMVADLILEQGSRRIVIDTKFTDILTHRQYGGEGLKSAHIYQLYAYLRSQTGGGDPAADTAEGLLLHPSIYRTVDEAVTIQGHRLRFATVDLTETTDNLKRRLLEIVGAGGDAITSRLNSTG